MVGRTLGSYRLTSLLGAGGMGEVYRARDEKLGRDVAIKVLPHGLLADAEHRARLEREARVLASLNHPNIGTIYGIENADGVPALVLELVEGPTLADRLALGPLPIAEALAIALQAADALDAAHSKGIVHRDLKPSNIKITPPRTVKVLDFGLAKACEAALAVDVTASPTVLADRTSAGTLIGTAAYMSPEQARGLGVDKRADIWAFGCVLFEMLAGRRPFDGQTLPDVIAKVMEREPDWALLPAATPPAVRRVLKRCLRKDQSERLRDIADARADLADADADRAAAPPPASNRRLRWLAVAAPLVAAAVGWWARGTSTVATPGGLLADAKFSRLTDFEGIERDAAISPDGKFVAFASDRDGPFDVWLTQPGSGRMVNLTGGREPNLDSSIRPMGFANDATELWLHSADPPTPLYLLPLFGGPPKVFLAKSPGKTPPVEAAWSVDGTQIAYHTSDAGDPIFVADRSGANAREIFAETGGIHHHWLAWSRDGQWIYFSRGNPLTDEWDLWRVGVAAGKPEALTHQNTFVAWPAPIDASTVLYVARDENGAGPWLWALDVDRRTTRRITLGMEKYTSVSASADGRRLVATVANPSASLWTIPILDRPVEERDARQLALPTVRAFAPRFGGASLFYVSSQGSADSVWRKDGAQLAEIWKGAEGALRGAPALSHDGTRLALSVRQGGAIHLSSMSREGSDLQPIAPGIQVQGTASWSPDDKWIVTGGRDEAGPGLFKIPVDGGAPVRLTQGPAFDPVWSPAGNLIVYAGANVSLSQPLLAVTPAGAGVELPPIQLRRDGHRLRFLPSGAALVYMQGVEAAQELWLLDVVTKQRRPLARLKSLGATRVFDVSPDGKSIVFDRVRDNSDIVLIDRPK